VTAILQHLGSIVYTVLLPILLIAAIGFVLQRKVGLDMATLTRLTFHYILPAVLISSLVASDLGAAEVGTIVAFTVVSVALTAALAYLAALLFRVPRYRRAPVVLGAAIQNAGNYGLTVQRLAFQAAGLADAATSLYSFYLVTQNVLTFTAGVALAASPTAPPCPKGEVRTRPHPLREAGRHMLRLPPIYAVAAGIIVVVLRERLVLDGPLVAAVVNPFWQVVSLVRGAFIGLAVLSLGAQLATLRAGRLDAPALLASVLRLVAGPLLAWGLIVLFGLRGLPAQVLLVGSANPTAVNVMLLSLQFRDDADTAARMVLYTTLASPLTVTIAIWAARSGLVG
jgi:malate permease and related proteins